MPNEVAPEMPPAYDELAKDGSGMPLAGQTPPAIPQTEQQQQYAEYVAQTNTPTIIPQGGALPEGAVIVEQQPQVVVVQQPGVGANYCHYCKAHVSRIPCFARFK